MTRTTPGPIRWPRRTLLACCAVLSATAHSAHAQLPDTLTASAGVAPLTVVGGFAEDRLRLGHLSSAAPTSGFLLRSTSTQTAALGGQQGIRWSVVSPSTRLAFNTDIPFSLNDGAMWAGRGINAAVSTGVRVAAGPVALTLAPELIYAENRDFQIIPSAIEGRSAFSYPWRVETQSIDLPVRFGHESLVIVDPGQSTLSIEAGRFAAGASSESQWWGPGIRNALVLSNNAGGIPHLFLRTAEPIETRVGGWEAKWIAGALVESLYFDSISANDRRPLSAFALTYTPRGEENLTLGLARAVYSSGEDGDPVLAHAADALTHWDTAPVADTLATESEQILSLFGRWVFPQDGFEVYAEWARMRLPNSFRDLLVAPNHSQGYTVGLQWVAPRGADVVRVQGELTYLEKSATVKQRNVPTFYTSRGVAQGYTHRGQVVGAAIGPGSSSQWFAIDYLAPRWRAGLFLNRIRWNSDFLYYTPSPQPGRLNRSAYAFDVSVLGGVRGGWSFGRYWFGAEIDAESRLNYLFQNPDLDFTSPGAVTMPNRTVRVFVEALR